MVKFTKKDQYASQLKRKSQENSILMIQMIFYRMLPTFFFSLIPYICYIVWINLAITLENKWKTNWNSSVSASIKSQPSKKPFLQTCWASPKLQPWWKWWMSNGEDSSISMTSTNLLEKPLKMNSLPSSSTSIAAGLEKLECLICRQLWEILSWHLAIHKKNMSFPGSIRSSILLKIGQS